MIDFDLYDYYKTSKDKKIILSFKGTISQQLLIDIGEIIKARSDTLKGTKRIFSVFIEMSQNVMYYSKERELDPLSGKEYGVGIVLFHETQEDFIVTSGNLAEKDKAEEIKQKVDELTQMDIFEVKECYKEIIRKPRKEGSKGAGLGLIDIVRKAEGLVECNVRNINKKESFLILSTRFKKEKIYAL
jgi:hypothetical protein